MGELDPAGFEAVVLLSVNNSESLHASLLKLYGGNQKLACRKMQLVRELCLFIDELNEPAFHMHLC